MKKLKTFLKSHWITVWLLVVAIAFTSIASAEYIVNKNRIRRVIANVADEGQQFSSNYLRVNGVTKKISFSDDNLSSNYCVIPIFIWNHSETNPQKAYEGLLKYDWSMQLVDKNGVKIEEDNPKLSEFDIGYSTDEVSYTSFTYDSTNGYYASGSNVEFDETDEGGNYVVDEKKLFVRFHKSALEADPQDDIYVRIIAKPKETKGLSEISATLSVQKVGKTSVRGWQGTFGDNKSNTDYDAFNYIISGNGDANITLSWCTDYLEMNQINIDEYGWGSSITTEIRDGKTWKVLTFKADSNAGAIQSVGDETTSASETTIGSETEAGIITDEDGVVIGIFRYDVQFYMTGDPDQFYETYAGVDYETGTAFWYNVNNYVDFDAE